MTLFQVTDEDGATAARAGELRLGPPEAPIAVPTPVFMPVGTQASVKSLWQHQLEELDYRLILGNTYHLHLRPGDERIAHLGGLARFMSWGGAILTDSGGFQAFSLADRVRLLEHGVEFQSHIDGSRRMFTPAGVLDIQARLGSDISMVLDDCPPGGADRSRLLAALERTHLWAKLSIEHRAGRVALGSWDPERQRVFGIVQGGTDPELRRRSVEFISSLPFDGVAVGGLSVGETREAFHSTLAVVGPLLDKRPRYLMGVGTVTDLLEAVRWGFDMFDCVLPTRNARNGQLLTGSGRVNIRNAAYADDASPPESGCECRVCQRYSRAYLRHLFVAREMLGPELATYHNLFFMRKFMRSMREAIQERRFAEFYERWKKVEGRP